MSPFSIGRNRFIFSSSWVLLCLLHYSILRSFGVSVLNSVVDSLISNVALACGCLLISNTLQYYRPKKSQYLYLVAWCVAICGIWSAVVKWGLYFIFINDAEYQLLLDRSMTIRFNIALLVTGCVSLISVLWYNLEEQQLDAKRKVEIETLAKEAELYKLRQQLQPHFLFNSLNSISALAGTQPEQARKMIHQLSDFLRGTLKKEDVKWITLDEEVAHLQLYLDIEKVRFSHRLNTMITNEGESLQARIPPMILQPVVENAIKFGLYDTIGDIEIRIHFSLSSTDLVIKVENPYDPETSSPSRGTGFGLKSLQRRLYLLFARNDLLETVSSNGQFITTIKIPGANDKSSDN